MTIKIGDTLPEGTLAEFIESETEGCALGPNTFNVQDLVKGKKIAIFGLPGAYTPTCSCLLYTSPSPRDQRGSRMPSSA